MKTLLYKLFYTKKKWILALIWLINIGNGIRLNYPPTLEQIRIGGANLWLVRGISLLLIWIGLKFLYSFMERNLGDKVALLSILLVSISPVISTLWINHPVESGLFVLIAGGIEILKRTKWWLIIGILIFGLNLIRFGEKSPVVSLTKFSEIQMEVNERFLKEDVLTYRNELPLGIRRVGYNKITFLGMRLAKLIIPFFDMDSIFFAEIHPTNNKTMVIFFWPAAILFLVGGYKILNHTNGKGKHIMGMLFISLMYFVSSAGAVSERLILIVIPLSIVCAAGLVDVGWWKGLMGGFLLYGFVSNWNDMVLRTEYWFDNRPKAMEFFFNNNRKLDNTIFVSNKLEGSTEYCRYYRGDCDNVNLVGFDLSTGEIQKGTYVGFVGEFVGKSFSNNFGDDWKEKINNMGLTIVRTYKLENSIAHQYGDYLVEATK